MSAEKLSILFPWQDRIEYRPLSEETKHDLGLDALCKQIGQTPQERKLIEQTISNLTDDPDVANYRAAVFSDLYHHQELRNKLLEQLKRIDFLQEYGGMRNNFDEDLGVWDLLHRLDEIRNYIRCVELIKECLSSADISSEGLKSLLVSVERIYNDHSFSELKCDVDKLRATTDNLKSVTLGVNLNERFEALNIGLISINSKPFTKSGVISNLADAIIRRDNINKEADWQGQYHFSPATGERSASSIERMANLTVVARNPLLATTMASIPSGTAAQNVMQTMDSAANVMLSSTAKHLRSVLHRYVTLTVQDIVGLIPEFLFYIRMAEYIEKCTKAGWRFARAEANAQTDMDARGIYNLKLIGAVSPAEAVTNDLSFDRVNRMYILTGANRGGKTTITQAIGQLYVFAQAGIPVPGDTFCFIPVDYICTHFPADEDKTLDFGRLGEECARFRELYQACTEKSLILLNETFSTTSFEEGYDIAFDACRALLNKRVRTVYNTHMHKLAETIGKMNDGFTDAHAQSLVAVSSGGKRSFKVKIGPPEGTSMAKDIAEKYGVTFEMLTSADS